jgi:hypothetical protein
MKLEAPLLMLLLDSIIPTVLVLSINRSQAINVSAAFFNSPESNISSRLHAVPDVTNDTLVY